MNVEHRIELPDRADSASTEQAIIATLATAARVAIAIMVAIAAAHGAVELVTAL